MTSTTIPPRKRQFTAAELVVSLACAFLWGFVAGIFAATI